VILSPLYLWLGAMSSVPHKEERFAYVVYPQVRGELHCQTRHPTSPRLATQVCLSAALALDAFVELLSCRRVSALSKHMRKLATVAAWVAVAGSWVLRSDVGYADALLS